MNKRPFIILSAFLLLHISLWCAVKKGRSPQPVLPGMAADSTKALPYGHMFCNFFNGSSAFSRGDVRVEVKGKFWWLLPSNVVSTPHTVELMLAEGKRMPQLSGSGLIGIVSTFVLPGWNKRALVVLILKWCHGQTDSFIWMVNASRTSGEVIYLYFRPDCQWCTLETPSALLFSRTTDDNLILPETSIYIRLAYHGGIYRDVWMIAKSPEGYWRAYPQNR